MLFFPSVGKNLGLLRDLHDHLRELLTLTYEYRIQISFNFEVKLINLWVLHAIFIFSAVVLPSYEFWWIYNYNFV